MHTSVELSLAAPSVPVPGHDTLRRLLATGMARAQDSASMVMHAVRRRPTCCSPIRRRPFGWR